MRKVSTCYHLIYSIYMSGWRVYLFFHMTVVHTPYCASTFTLIMWVFWWPDINLNEWCVYETLRVYLLCQFVEHACADSCRVCTEDVLLSFLNLPVILVPGTGNIKRTMKWHQNPLINVYNKIGGNWTSFQWIHHRSLRKPKLELNAIWTQF